MNNQIAKKFEYPFPVKIHPSLYDYDAVYGIISDGGCGVCIKFCF